MTSIHILASAAAAFLASLVEFVEALTVILAVGSVRGWRPAIAGGVTGLVLLLTIVAVLGPTLEQVPLAPLQIVVGGLLLLFGLRWLQKAILRAAGILPLHDEAAVYARETARLRGIAHVGTWDWLAFSTSLQITVLEGMEVVFILVAVVAGGTGLLEPAILGALAALLVVLAVAVAVHTPLTSVPENTLKLIVGALLSAFGTFWLGEGVSIAWPGGDLGLLALSAAYLVLGLLLAVVCRRPMPDAAASLMRSIVLLGRQMLRLFIDDAGFAAAILLWTVVGVLVPRWTDTTMTWRGPLLFAGLALLLAWACLRRVLRRLQ